MAHFLKVASFDIFDEETGTWADPEHWWLDGEMVYLSDLAGEDGEPVLTKVPHKHKTDLASIPKFPPLLRMLFKIPS